MKLHYNNMSMSTLYYTEDPQRADQTLSFSSGLWWFDPLCSGIFYPPLSSIFLILKCSSQTAPYASPGNFLNMQSLNAVWTATMKCENLTSAVLNYSLYFCLIH